MIGRLLWLRAGALEWRRNRLLVRGRPVPAGLAGVAMSRSGRPLQVDGMKRLPVSREATGLRTGAGQIVLSRRRAA